MNSGEQKALDDIGRYGCHVLHVLEEGELPPFSYSVGIHKTSNEPEIIVVGLEEPIAHFIVNEYNGRVRAGERFKIGACYSGFIEGFECQVRAVDPSRFKEYMGWCLWFYKGPNFHAIQLVYPTTTGIWPWEPKASESFRAWQPLLDTPCVEDEH
jgi:hypothetical protein